MIPGEYLLESEPITANAGREQTSLLVRHTGDRPIQVGSHYHFFEVNNALAFDREKARGMRLNVPAGTGLRFEPGEEKQVSLVAFGGLRRIFGHQGRIKSRRRKTHLSYELVYRPSRLCRFLWPYGGRSCPPRRHGPLH
jgi:urease beta subunit